MPDFKAAIFDLDGTLIDSMGVWDKIDVDFLAKRNLPVPENYGSEISSKSFREAAEYTIALFGLNERVEDIMAEWNRMAIDEYGNHISLKYHAGEYLLSLKEQGIRLGVATALPKALYEPVLRNNGIYGLFDAFASNEEINRGKDSPEIYLLAAKRLHVPPCDCAVFEDILPGIRGIVSVGMQAYGVYDRTSEQDKEQIQALSRKYIYDFAELL
jgi:haloacid dehalogenase superfamily, subfamily IA, variant 3 with third motif having DD or ED